MQRRIGDLHWSGPHIFAGLRPGSEWTMDVTNESGDLIFQIRLYSWVLG